MDFNKEKFKNVLHYIIHKCGHKSNFNFFELYETSLTNESYRKLPRGPAPIHFDVAIDELTSEGKIDIKTKNLPSERIMYNYSSLEEPEMDFASEELSVIDDVLETLSDMNANQISEYSHGDMPWRATEDYEIIDYGFVFYRNPEYVKRNYGQTD